MQSTNGIFVVAFITHCCLEGPLCTLPVLVKGVGVALVVQKLLAPFSKLLIKRAAVGWLVIRSIVLDARKAPHIDFRLAAIRFDCQWGAAQIQASILPRLRVSLAFRAPRMFDDQDSRRFEMPRFFGPGAGSPYVADGFFTDRKQGGNRCSSLRVLLECKDFYRVGLG